MAHPAWSVLLGTALVAVFLAGCIGGDELTQDEKDSGATPDKSQEASFSDTTGAIKGTVASNLFEPLAGARVTLLDDGRQPIGIEAVVARDGTFAMSDVEPATYLLHVSAIGFESMQKAAVVEAGKVTEVAFRLEPLPSDGPWVQDHDVDGFVNWAVAWQVEPPVVGCVIIPTPGGLPEVKSCGGLRGGGENGEIRIGPEENPPGWPGNNANGLTTDLLDAKTILIEMVWTPAGTFGEHFLFDFMCSENPRGSGGAILDPEHPCYFEQRGASPLVHRVDEEHWLEHGYNFTGQWAARVFATHGMLGTHGLTGIDAGFAYQQSFRLYVTVFHGEPAPADYSRIPDS